MPLTVLASVSLLALVVTGRPVLTPDPRLVEASGEVHSAVQAIIESRLGPSATKLLGESEGAPSDEDQIHLQETSFQVHLTSSESQTEVLAELASEKVKLIIPLNDLARDSAILPTSEEKTLLDALESLNDLDGDTNLQLSLGLDGVAEGEYDVLEIEDVDGLSPEDVAELMPNRGSWWVTLLDETRRPILVSAACAAAFILICLCTVTVLYAMDFIKVNLFNSRDIYNILPGVEKGGLGAPLGKVGAEEKKPILDSLKEEQEEEVFNEKTDIGTENHPRPSSPSTGTPLPLLPYPEAEAQDFDDSFEGAPDDGHDDPDFLPLPDHANQQPLSTPSRRPMNPQMRERTSTNLPPSWSVRASESQPLSIPGAYVFDPLPLPFSEATTETGELTHRLYSDRNPEIDIALAMQLRPGLGEGADAAWLVRFLMGIFGWMTVMVSGT